MQTLDEFREDVRAWLEENCPLSMRSPPKSDDELVFGGRKAVFPSEDAKVWLERMAAKGWTAPRCPSLYGGGGLSSAEASVLSKEMRRIGARSPIVGTGLAMLCPALLEFANEEQKKLFIPPIVKGEIRWCQGYSEPVAGSDLASLQTSAEDKGDYFIVNGHKIWTSLADKSDWIFCLVRTDKTKKHEGISFLLIDMASEGVEARPIKLISGASIFCETFFTNVIVPKNQLVGERNKGWTIAKRLLQHERSMISEAFSGSSDKSSLGMPELAKSTVGEFDSKINDPLLRAEITAYEIKNEAFKATLKRAGEEAATGSELGATSSMLKYYGTEKNKRRYEMLLKILGNQALGWEGDGFSSKELRITRNWLRSKGNSIEGGTSEIQLNVIAKRVLGLPD